MKRYMALLICIFMLVGMMPAVALAEGGIDHLSDYINDPITDPIIDNVASPTDYTVTVTNDGNGAASADPASGATGTVVTLTATPNEGYQFKEWQVVSGGVTIADNKFTIGTENVEVKAIFEAIPAAVYTVTVTTDGNGTASASPASGVTGTEVTLTANPKDGYTFADWQVVSGGVTITGNKFTIGTENVVVKALFEKQAEPVVPELKISHSKIVYGKTLTIKIEIDGAMARAASIGTLTLKVNEGKAYGKDIAVTVDELPFELKIPANRNHGFKVGSNTVEIIFTGVDGVLVSSGEEKVTVTNDCKTMHYCCGEDHYNGKCVTVRAGEDVTFKVDLRCDETCQWYVDKGDGYGFTKISGATCASLTIKDVTRQQDGYRYRCVIKNCCETVGKPIFTLNVASGQLYTPKTGDSSAITIAAGCAALAAMMLVANRREKRAK